MQCNNGLQCNFPPHSLYVYRWKSILKQEHQTLLYMLQGEKLSTHDDFIAEDCINYTRKLCKASRLSFFFSCSSILFVSSLHFISSQCVVGCDDLILLKWCNPFLISDFLRVVEMHICNRNVVTIYSIYGVVFLLWFLLHLVWISMVLWYIRDMYGI